MPVIEEIQDVDERDVPELAPGESEKVAGGMTEAALDALAPLGMALASLFDEYETDRLSVEQRWMEDLRQYNGVYDPEVLNDIRAAEGSELYLNITRPKVNTFAARLQDMLLPTDERNFAAEPTPVPTLAGKMDDPKQATDPETGQPMVAADGKTPVSNAAFAKSIQEEAAERAQAMEDEIADQFAEGGYNAVTRRAIDELALYGAGIAKGPIVTDKKRTRWAIRKLNNGAEVYTRVEEPDPKPAVKWVSCWNFYPDMSASGPDGFQGCFEQHIVNKREFRKIAKEMGFYEPAVDRVLADDSKADFAPYDIWWMAEMRALTDSAATSSNDLFATKYRLLQYHGEVTPEDLKAAGFDVEALGLEDGAHAVVWFCKDIVCKVSLSPLDSGAHPYSIAYCERDPTSPFGQGIARIMRGEARAAAAAWRMLFDNSGLSVAPQLLMRKRGLHPVDGNFQMRPRKTWLIDDEIPNVNNAFGFVGVPSAQEELTNLVNLAARFADDVTSQPLIAQGDQAPHITKTARGMSILFNAANVVTRRVVKFFDDFYTVPLVNRFYEWNMQFNPREDIKGDFRCVGRGASVLLEKEQMNETYMQVIQLAVSAPQLEQNTDIRTLWENALKNMRIEGVALSEEDAAAKREETMKMYQAQAQAAEAEAQAAKDPMAADKIAVERERIALEREKNEQLISVKLAEIAARGDITTETLLSRVAELKLRLDHEAKRFNAEANLKTRMGSGI